MFAFSGYERDWRVVWKRGGEEFLKVACWKELKRDHMGSSIRS